MKSPGLIFCILVLFISLLWAPVGQAAPQLMLVEGTAYDFGEIQPNSKVSHSFILKNLGESMLHIKSVKAG